MEWLYDTRNRRIRKLIHNSNWIDLTELESKLVEGLSNGHVNTYKDLLLYTYNSDKYNMDNKTVQNIRMLKNYLLNKIDLDIKVIYSYGLRLEDEIYIM